MTTSFVLSVRNGGHALSPTLDSILSQSDRDLELIVVDDGSTDSTPSVLAELARADDRVHVLTQESTGLTRALIRGCAAARGKYIARHDAGDLSSTRRLALQRGLLDANDDLVFVSCWTDFVGPENEPLYTATGSGYATSPRRVLDLEMEWGMADGPSHHGSVLFRADAYRAVGGYRASFYYGQDWDLWYRLAAAGMFQMIPEPLYTARIDARSISSTSRNRQRELAALSLAAARARAAGTSDEDIVKRAASLGRVEAPGFCADALGLYFIGELLRRKRDARARSYFLRALRSCPLHGKAWVRLIQSLLS